MSWLKTALTISTLSSNTYFTTVDPAEFYEWKFKGVIPRGTRFSKTLPRSDTFTTGSLVVNAELGEDCLRKMDNNLVLNANIPSEIVLTVGNFCSPNDLIEKHRLQTDRLFRDMHKFQSDAARRVFLVSKTDRPKLYRLVQADENDVKFENYGFLKGVFEKLEETRKALEKDSGVKKGRAREMDLWRRYENIMTLFENGTLPLDTAKMEFILKASKIKSESIRSASWESFYTEMFPDAQKQIDIIKSFSSKEWVQHLLS